MSVQTLHVAAHPGLLVGFRSNIPGFAELESVVIKHVAGETLRPGEKRLLSALRWFGDAWSEALRPAKLVKFATSVEALLAVQKGDPISETLAERASLLATADFAEAKAYYKDVKDVYAGRSEAVHGGGLRSDKETQHRCKLAEKIAGNMLFCCANVFPLIARGKGWDETFAQFFIALKLGGRAEAQKVLFSEQSLPGDRA